MVNLKSQEIPKNYSRLEGSERRPSKNARLVGPLDGNEIFSVTIVLRRRLDGPPMPDFDHYTKTPLAKRRRLGQEEFAEKYGARPDDIKKVVSFVENSGLTVVETHPGRRTVVVSGTVSQMSKAFAVSLNKYEHEITMRRHEKPGKQTYRGRDGFIYVPTELTDIIIGVFGLDNRNITKRNGDPPGTTTLTVPQVTGLYNFPTNSASGQTIGVFCEGPGGYDLHDITPYFTDLGMSVPTITDISVHGSNTGVDYTGEITMDIDICGSAAPGAAIAAYFTTYDQVGWVDCVNRVIHPSAGDPLCSVLSCSWYVCDGDDPAGIAYTGATTAWLSAMTLVFQDAATQNVTICIASGDNGTQSKVPDGIAHVQYPGSDPWVLSVGGTTVGNIVGTSFDEYLWNDDGATGGGVSAMFSLPSYQSSAGVPPSMNTGAFVGRGVPDVAANASGYSGYPYYVGGYSNIACGTSASAPLWAGLIAMINAAIGTNVGFINPVIYQLRSLVFRDIVGVTGTADNGYAGVAGYPAGTGWDACTGCGSPNGVKLLNCIISWVVPKTLQFWVDKSTFGIDEVTDIGNYVNAFWLVVEGYNLDILGSVLLGSATPATLTCNSDSLRNMNTYFF